MLRWASGHPKVMRSLLHVGCGSDPLPAWAQGFTETRLDINPQVAPDIVASMLDMGEIGEFDAVLCVHALEHVYPHEVARALGEFRRVLKPGGFAMVFVPDLEGVTPTAKPLFVSPSGPISGIDLFYGYRPALEENPYMAHKTGFVSETLEQALADAGFGLVKVSRLGNYDMLGVGINEGSFLHPDTDAPASGDA